MTVKDIKETLEEMKKIYDFKDEGTQIQTFDRMSGRDNQIEIITRQADTGIIIKMTKQILPKPKPVEPPNDIELGF